MDAAVWTISHGKIRLRPAVVGYFERCPTIRAPVKKLTEITKNERHHDQCRRIEKESQKPVRVNVKGLHAWDEGQSETGDQQVGEHRVCGSSGSSSQNPPCCTAPMVAFLDP